MHRDAQVRLLRQKMKEGMTQEAAAAAVGMSVRSARKWQRGSMPSEASKARHWRTRADPFADVWECEVVPLLRSDRESVLEAKTLLAHLQEKHPGAYAQILKITHPHRLTQGDQAMARVRNFLQEEWGGVITTEYIIFVVFIGIVLAVGVFALSGGLSALFGKYAVFFQSGS